MSTYSHTIGIQWGTGGAPTAVRVVDATGAVRTPTLTTAIAESIAGSGFYHAVATYDEAWGVPLKDLWGDGGAEWYAGDMDGPADVRFINGASADPLPNVQQAGPIAQDGTDPVQFRLSVGGLTPSVLEVTKPLGGGATAAGGTLTDLGGGVYRYRPTAFETETLGSLTLRVVAGGEEVSVVIGVVGAIADVLMANVAAGESTTSVIVCGEAFDDALEDRYVGNLLIHNGAARRIAAYDNPGSGASRFTLAAALPAAPAAGEALKVVINRSAGAGGNVTVEETEVRVE